MAIYTCAECGIEVEYPAHYIGQADTNGVFICFECMAREGYIQCADCGGWMRSADASLVRSERGTHFVCRECVSDESRYALCPECGRYSPRSEFTEGQHACAICLWGERRDRVSQRGMNSYKYKPKPLFMKNDGTETFEWRKAYRNGFELGVELEVDDQSGDAYIDDCIRDVNALSHRFYAKHDGSLERGIEWVSHPATLVAHKKFVPWKELMERCLYYDFASHDPGTCGLHVHVTAPRDREKRDKIVAKLMVFMVRHHDTLQRLSRREGDSRYAQSINEAHVRGVNTDTENHPSALRRIVHRCESTRYLWLNNNNSRTIEFRLWRGTLRYESFMAALELTDAMFRYCSSHSMQEVLESSFESIYDNDRYEYIQPYVDYRGGIFPPKSLCLPARSSLNAGDIVLVRRVEGEDMLGVVRNIDSDYSVLYDLIGVEFPRMAQWAQFRRRGYL